MVALSVKIRRIDFSPDEWLAGTTELQNDERGVYITLCALIYSRGGPVETEVLRSLCPGDLRPFKRILNRLVALGKVELNGSELSQKRCLSELELCRKRALSSSESGRKGGRPRNENNNIGNPPLPATRKLARALPSTINHQPSPVGSEDKESSGGESPPGHPFDPVKDLWDRGLKIVGTDHRSLLGKMRKVHGDPAVLAAIVSCEEQTPSEQLSYFVKCLSKPKPNDEVAPFSAPGFA